MYGIYAMSKIIVNERLIDEVNYKLRVINGHAPVKLSAADVMKEAICVYDWILEQIMAGRAVVSVNKDLNDLVQIKTPYIPAEPPKV